MRMWFMMSDVVLVLIIVNILLDLMKIDSGNRRIAVKDLGNFFEGRTFGLDVEEVDEYELDKVPELHRQVSSCTTYDTVASNNMTRLTV